MPANSKPIANMSKNLTRAERAARAQAESELLPERSVQLKAPAYVNSDKTAKKYWRSIVKRIEGISLLDALDTEMLAVYCTMLSRRDAMNELCHQLMLIADDESLSQKERLESMDKLDSLVAKLQSHERTILQYAEKLGLTPSGRVRLAKKRAENIAGEEDDLFGD